MNDKDSTQSAEPATGQSTEAQEAGTPDADAQNAGKGIKSRLTDAQREMLASKSRGGAGSQSVSHGHKPTQASGKQGPAQKKVRW